MTRYLLVIEMMTFASIAVWMAWSTYKSTRTAHRYLDPVRFMFLLYNLLLCYRDWRIVFVNDSDRAIVVMCVCGLILSAFATIAAKSYGRGDLI